MLRRMIALLMICGYGSTIMESMNYLELNDGEADDALFSILFDVLFSWDFLFDKFSTKLSERKSEVLASLPTRW